MNLRSAQRYLEAVCEKRRCVVSNKYNKGYGRTAQAKEFKRSQGRWPIKSAKIVLDLLRNAEANADFKNLDADNLVIKFGQVQRAQKGRRRTYRAHGRINPYMNSPCHIQLILEEKDDEGVEKPDDEEASKVKKFTRKQLAKRRLKVGGK